MGGPQRTITSRALTPAPKHPFSDGFLVGACPRGWSIFDSEHHYLSRVFQDQHLESRVIQLFVAWIVSGKHPVNQAILRYGRKLAIYFGLCRVQRYNEVALRSLSRWLQGSVDLLFTTNRRNVRPLLPH